MDETIAVRLLTKLLSEGQIEYGPSLQATFDVGTFHWAAILRGLKGAIELTPEEEVYVSRMLVTV